jgi:hypothetical protein
MTKNFEFEKHVKASSHLLEFSIGLTVLSFRRHDTHHNDIQHNDSQHIEHICDTQNKWHSELP